MKTKNNYSIEEVAVLLNITNGTTFTMGYKMMFDHLRDFKILKKVGAKNLPDDDLLRQGIFATGTPHKNGKSHFQPRVTQKGLSYFREHLVPRLKVAEVEYWKLKYPRYLQELECWCT